ncbi:MAG: hypothetical protein WCG02_02895 [Candidatus Taylorbacteria bacterium]
MTTKAFEKSIQKLSSEISTLRSFVIESVRNEDDEGEYKGSFLKNVRKMLKQQPTLSYSGKGSLLRQLRRL